MLAALVVSQRLVRWHSAPWPWCCTLDTPALTDVQGCDLTGRLFGCTPSGPWA